MEARDGSYGQDGSGGKYMLRDLIKDVPLATDTEQGDSKMEAHITCVDTWNGNLYIGTSTGEVLHYVSLPPDPSDDFGQPSYIFASRLEPPYNTRQEGADEGVKQILLLTNVGKACILCNGMYSFYTLPELSPAFGGRIKQAGCSWIGGLDINRSMNDGVDESDTIMVICLRQTLRLVRVSRDDKDPRKIRGDIQLGGICAIQRRGDLACVADGSTYALLDVLNQRKNDLFSISSLTPPEPEEPKIERPRSGTLGASQSFSSRSSSRQARSHDRSVSSGGQPSDADRLQPDNGSSFPPRSSSRQILASAQPSSRTTSPATTNTPSPRASTDVQDRTLPAPPMPASTPVPKPVLEPSELLPPNIASPTPDEFLLTTGTKMADPGVGMFVNVDGDPTRGTLEFSSYPESLVLDGSGQSEAASTLGVAESEGYVLAIVRRQTAEGVQRAVEIQRWDADTGDVHQSKEWLLIGTLGGENDRKRAGLRKASSTVELSFPEISVNLRLRRLSIIGDEAEPDENEIKRNKEEDKFAARFAQVTASVLLYSEDRVSWITRNPLIMQLERQLDLAILRGSDSRLSIDVPGVQTVVNGIRGQEPRNELEFLTLTYIRQKASLLLFGNLVLKVAHGSVSHELEKRFAEEALVAGDIDPRLILALVPPLSENASESGQGIWIAQGLRDTIRILGNSFDANQIVQDPKGSYGTNLLAIVRRYLLVWRQKKGFGSVADEANVFQTVDAALLHIYLIYDQNSPRGPATPGTVRAELNELVDGVVENFDRAVELLEKFKRTYMLSRFYQSHRMAAQVLATWKRILEGEDDAGGEFVDGENDVRRYLTKISNKALVEEYGSWLSSRNPKLGVRVFTDNSSRVKFEPSEAVRILKEKAPGAVKDYLENLVFERNHISYVNDLIAFYLDTVLHELDNSSEARQALLNTYQTYRALRPPKPTYRHFMEDNANDVEWQQNRLRLLQLIGGSHGAASAYDVHSLRQRLASYSDELVPEMIILNGREGKHEEALRLLTHGLGDYDTAVRYCLLGGSSIFHPSDGLAPDQPRPTREDQSRLFEHLLDEFFHIEDLSDRLERTAELLERFDGWFDIAKVLASIPDSWSVELVSGFLIHALRRLVSERNETVIVKALATSQNLKRTAEIIEKIERAGPTVITESTVDVDAG